MRRIHNQRRITERRRRFVRRELSKSHERLPILVSIVHPQVAAVTITHYPLLHLFATCSNVLRSHTSRRSS